VIKIFVLYYEKKTDNKPKNAIFVIKFKLFSC